MTPDNTYRDAGRPTKDQSLALARALLAQAKASLCTHGVPPKLCADHDPRRQPEADNDRATARPSADAGATDEPPF